MSKSDYFEDAFLKLVFNATPIVGLADNAAVSPLTTLSVALHTADPGEAGLQSTSEIVYTGYDRVDTLRDATGWLVSGGNAYPVNAVEFPEKLGGVGGVATHASVGDAVGHILWSGPITPNLNCTANGVVPRLKGLSWFASGQASSVGEQ